jgi:DNA replication protein DnaC
MSDSLRATLKKLRLSGLAESLDIRLHEAATTGLNHREFLELLLQDELLVRNSRLIGKRTKTAGFREIRRLEDFDFTFNTSIKKNRIYDLADSFPGLIFRQPTNVRGVRVFNKTQWEDQSRQDVYFRSTVWDQTRMALFLDT